MATAPEASMEGSSAVLRTGGLRNFGGCGTYPKASGGVALYFDTFSILANLRPIGSTGVKRWP
jgi:hypothetical protein